MMELEETAITFSLTREEKKEIEEHLNKNNIYASKSHFIRVSIGNQIERDKERNGDGDGKI